MLILFIYSFHKFISYFSSGCWLPLLIDIQILFLRSLGPVPNQLIQSSESIDSHDCLLPKEHCDILLKHCLITSTDLPTQDIFELLWNMQKFFTWKGCQAHFAVSTKCNYIDLLQSDLTHMYIYSR